MIGRAGSRHVAIGFVFGYSCLDRLQQSLARTRGSRQTWPRGKVALAGSRWSAKALVSSGKSPPGDFYDTQPSHCWPRSLCNFNRRRCIRGIAVPLLDRSLCLSLSFSRACGVILGIKEDETSERSISRSILRRSRSSRSSVVSEEPQRFEVPGSSG